jgi:hypothetical protein
MRRPLIGDDGWTCRGYRHSMLTSYVLRFRPDLATGEHFNGEVEAVASGHREVFGSVVQLTEIILESFSDELARTEVAQKRRDSGGK